MRHYVEANLSRKSHTTLKYALKVVRSVIRFRNIVKYFNYSTTMGASILNVIYGLPYMELKIVTELNNL